MPDPAADWEAKGVTWQAFEYSKPALAGGLSSRCASLHAVGCCRYRLRRCRRSCRYRDRVCAGGVEGRHLGSGQTGERLLTPADICHGVAWCARSVIMGESGPLHLVKDALGLDAKLVPLWREMARYADAQIGVGGGQREAGPTRGELSMTEADRILSAHFGDRR